MFRVDRPITEVLRQHFTLSAEVIPPRNGQEAQILNELSSLIAAGAEFLSVTKGAGGSLRAGSLPIAQVVKERFGVPCIAHFTCRDLIPEEVENQLVDHSYFGIRNILALRGDPPLNNPDWKPKDGSYAYAYQLIEQIARLNRGQYLSRTGPAMEFCIGAAAYPEHPVTAERREFFQRKIDAGAQYGITQMVFDPEAYGRFVADFSVPVLAGTRVLASQEQALRMTQRFGCAVPDWLLDRLPPESLVKSDTASARALAWEAFLELAQRLKNAGAPGLHLFVLGDTVGTSEVITRLRKS